MMVHLYVVNCRCCIAEYRISREIQSFLPTNDPIQLLHHETLIILVDIDNSHYVTNIYHLYFLYQRQNSNDYPYPHIVIFSIQV